MSRSASPTLEGFRWQIVVSACRFVDLEEGHLLMLEASEDITTLHRASDGSRLRVVDEQLKHHSAPVSARSAPVYRSIFNFLCAFALEHHPKSWLPNYRFLTSAPRARQRLVAKIPHDLLAEWHTLEIGDFRKCMDGLISLYGKKWKKTADVKAAQAGEDELRRAYRYLDGSKAWDAFRTSVTWMLKREEPSLAVERLKTQLREDRRIQSSFSVEVLANQLIMYCLNVACESDVGDRCLTRSSFLRWATQIQLQLLSDERHLRAMLLESDGSVHVTFVEDVDSKFVVVVQVLSPALVAGFASMKEKLSPGARKNLNTSMLKDLAVQDLMKIHEWVEHSDYVAYAAVRSSDMERFENLPSSILWSALAPCRGEAEVSVMLGGTNSERWREPVLLYARSIGVEVAVGTVDDHDAVTVLAYHIGNCILRRLGVRVDHLSELYDSLRQKVRFVVVEKNDGMIEYHREQGNPLP